MTLTELIWRIIVQLATYSFNTFQLSSSVWLHKLKPPFDCGSITMYMFTAWFLWILQCMQTCPIDRFINRAYWLLNGVHYHCILLCNITLEKGMLQWPQYVCNKQRFESYLTLSSSPIPAHTHTHTYLHTDQRWVVLLVMLVTLSWLASVRPN